MQLVSAAENSSLDWRAQYRYVEYNVEGNERENRGYTAGIIGFCSKTGDMLEVVEHYESIAPKNPLSPFLPVLRKVNGTSSRKGLGKPFEKAWATASNDPKFRESQDWERDRIYFTPAVELAQKDGLQELGQFMYYDAAVMHGPDDGLGAIRTDALSHAKPPAQGGDEKTYLAAFADARKRAMRSEQAHTDTTRVDTLQLAFLNAGNLRLNSPLRFAVYGDQYLISAAATRP